MSVIAASTLTVMAGATVAPALPAMQAHFAHEERGVLLMRLVLTLSALAIVLTAPAGPRSTLPRWRSPAWKAARVSV